MQQDNIDHINCGGPLRLAYNRIERPVTGGYCLDLFQGVKNPADSHLLEEWIASATAVNGDARRGLSRLRDSDVTLDSLIRSNPARMLGRKHADQYGADPGILVKVIDPQTRLLIQAHPDRIQAQKLFGHPYGKTEAWYVIGLREKTAKVYLGFRESVTKEMWKAMFERQDSQEMLGALECFEVGAGDVIFIPAGIVHALGAGCMVAEIQEPTDITIRTERVKPDGSAVSDFMLHQGAGFEHMFDCFDYTPRTRGELERRYIFRADGVRPIRELISYETTPYFAMREITVPAGEALPLGKDDAYAVVLVLEGEGELIAGREAAALRQADELFLPAAVQQYEYRAKTALKLIEFLPPVAV